MTDYYAVLRKAVSGLENGPGDSRRSVYDKARNALIGQLKAIDPPLTTSEISRQRLELEEAIRKVEREVTVTTVGPPPARVRATAAVAEALAAEPREPQPPQYDQSNFAEYLEQELPPPAPPPQRPAARVENGPRPPIAQPPQYPPPYQPQSVPYRAPQLERQERDYEPEIGPQWPQPARRPSPEPQAPREYPQPPRREPGPPRDRFPPQQEPLIDPPAPIAAPFAAESEWPADPFSAGPEPDDGFSGRGGDGRRLRSSRRDDDYAAAPARSRWPTIILIVLIVALIAGIGALFWTQRRVVKDVMGDLITSLDQKEKPSLSETPAADSGSDASSKNADRLGGTAEAPKSVRTVDAQPAEGGEADPLAAAPAPEQPAPAPVQPAPVAATPTPAPAAGADQADDSLVAQKGLLYEQPLGGGQPTGALNASVTWKFDANSSNGPEIQAKLDVPERGMKVTLNIRKNNDATLPASHLVEVIIDTGPEFTPGGIKAVPAFIMKPTEQSRGQPLDGAAAKVADGFFWIAFSNDTNAVANNLALLREREWIDIPIVYNNDQKAILTLDKGTPGQRVFEKALAAWGN